MHYLNGKYEMICFLYLKKFKKKKPIFMRIWNKKEQTKKFICFSYIGKNHKRIFIYIFKLLTFLF